MGEIAIYGHNPHFSRMTESFCFITRMYLYACNTRSETRNVCARALLSYYYNYYLCIYLRALCGWRQSRSGPIFVGDGDGEAASFFSCGCNHLPLLRCPHISRLRRRPHALLCICVCVCTCMCYMCVCMYVYMCMCIHVCVHVLAHSAQCLFVGFGVVILDAQGCNKLEGV